MQIFAQDFSLRLKDQPSRERSLRPASTKPLSLLPFLRQAASFISASDIPKCGAHSGELFPSRDTLVDAEGNTENLQVICN